MTLSKKDKLWLIANIEKVFAPISGLILFFCISKTTQEGKGQQITEILDPAGIIVLLIVAFFVFKQANKIAQFAGENFDEVVSRSTKYRKSNIELHELKYRYTLKRLGWSFFSIYAPIFSTILMIEYYINY